MHSQIKIGNRPVTIETSTAADTALEQRTTPLLAEMELYFSCLIRKKVRFREQQQDPGHINVSKTLAVCFRPVMTESCNVGDFEHEPPVTDFPIANPDAFTPHWLHIDFRNGQWKGEFGYG